MQYISVEKVLKDRIQVLGIWDALNEMSKSCDRDDIEYVCYGVVTFNTEERYLKLRRSQPEPNL